MTLTKEQKLRQLRNQPYLRKIKKLNGELEEIYLQAAEKEKEISEYRQKSIEEWNSGN